MSPAAALSALAVLAGLAALRELYADYGELVSASLGRRLRRLPLDGPSLARLSQMLDLQARVRRAGLDQSLGARGLLASKTAGAGIGGLCFVAMGSGLGTRGTVIVFALCALAGFLAPDLVLERAAARRSARVRVALADNLDLIALELGAGLPITRVLEGRVASGGGPLADELRRALTRIEVGELVGRAIAGLGAGSGITELADAGRALERSHRLGLPAGRELQMQARALRRQRAREIRESADRAAPKIQLVVALVLVPAVLLIIVAGLIAHSGTLLDYSIASE